MDILFCITYGSGFTYYSDFNLTRISHFILYLLSYIVRESFNSFIIYLVGADNYAQFTAGLDSISFDNAGTRECEIFEVVKAFDISLYDFAAGTRASSGNSITHLHDRGK